jgi:predicted Zn-dependent peptidase
VYFVQRRDAVQSQLWFAVEGDPVDKADIAAALAYREYMGGSMAGLVFQEIREFRALAYSAFADYRRDESVEQRSHLLGYVGCQADKTQEALEVMMGLISDMPRKPDRLDLVRRSLLRNQETESPSFRDLQASVQSWRYRGYTQDPRTWLRPAFESISFEDVLSFYERNVKGRPVAVMVVGDPRKVDVDELAKYGKVVRIREGKVYSP